MLEYSDEDGSDYEDVDEDVDADSYGDDDEDSDEDSSEEVPLDVLLARLVDSDANVRVRALRTLGEFSLRTLGHLGPVALGPHADTLVERLEDADANVRYWALKALRKLEPLAFAQHAHAVVGKLNDPFPPVRELALQMLWWLPRVIARHINFRSHNLRSRLLGRLAWYRCLLRLRVRRITLYWYALPYRPSGPGHARDVAAWGRMHEE